MKIDAETTQPLQVAARRISEKTPIGAVLKSKEWEGMPVALRERSFFTAQLAREDIAQEMHEMLGKGINLLSEPAKNGDRLMNRSLFVRSMRDRLQALGYIPPAGKEGSLQDFMSAGRLRLIWDTNIRMAQEHARWKAGMDDGSRAAFPAWELVREKSRKVPREWVKRWTDNGGTMPGGRLIALKDDPIWTKISRFGTPWPPFDFNSGMGTRAVSRETCIDLGLIKKGQVPKRADVAFNDDLQASVKSLSQERRAELQDAFGDQVRVDGDIVRWQAQNHQFPMMWDVLDGGGGKAAVQAMKETNILIGEIHEMPDAPILPIFDHVALPDADGEYWPAASSTNRVGVGSPKTATGRFAQVHEVGHYVDEWVFGGGKGFGSQSLRSKDMVALMDAITSSNGFLEALIRDQQDILSKVRSEIYWTSSQELFARAYAQWIALKSQDLAMGRELAIRQQYSGVQWADADFKKIAEAMDQLFAGRNLLK